MKIWMTSEHLRLTFDGPLTSPWIATLSAQYGERIMQDQAKDISLYCQDELNAQKQWICVMYQHSKDFPIRLRYAQVI